LRHGIYDQDENIGLDGVKWRQRILWSRFNLQVAWHRVVLCEVNWWRSVTLLK